ncbi:kynurenine 3-monooxygenase-like [Xenia sp. Carnegie-2017]|uniref:kynurenine 3-monooxygenase-like n=1 Tax=Xenia sp. Carnegie-2017 TaxID=2897299 RepID=UPI001F043D25|nr:kynurenine 3-monooxygenase-like [Xenia sp. Carnegie-2017]
MEAGSGGEIDKGSISIVGAGLVGTLNAIYLSKRGYNVNVFEAREDIRKQKFFEGRSINLSLATRGQEALEKAGVVGPVMDEGLPMYGRYIHEASGKTKIMSYGSHGERLYSINRRTLNEYLLTEAESLPNVHFYFEHKLTSIDFEETLLVFTRPDQTTFTVQSKAIFGNDGAYSLIRREMSKQPWYNYKQEYIAHGYQELCIPSNEGEYKIDPNFLHVWPRDSFMLIAMPNGDGSFNCTLIMPCKMFDDLKTEDEVLKFFKIHFQDLILLMGEKQLVEKFFSCPPSPMVSVKCSPYHIKDKVLIMGDAAHAMVPFYGQGMNCAFEDCLILNDLLDIYNDDFGKAFEQFTITRCPDAHAICDLSYYNYVEMRKLLNTRVFFLKTFLIKVLNRLMPRTFIPLVNMVAFSRIPYHEAVVRWNWQEKMVTRLSWISLGIPVMAASAIAIKKYIYN